ncbi:tigger transposable element-derived protein 1-like [Palaemon carinicauda]|uniref:tigger transposable element-derived protein 1-like n=1 Tax=Palaemon carinicauda TaxID=392227 RepID=UPI0035B66B5A
MSQASLHTKKKGTLKASHGSLENFKRRTGIHSVLRNSEALSSNVKVEETFVVEFERFMDSESYMPQQVSNCEQTSLFWKKIPGRTFITTEEKTISGHEPMKYCLTLMLCANANEIAKSILFWLSFEEYTSI